MPPATRSTASAFFALVLMSTAMAAPVTFRGQPSLYEEVRPSPQGATFMFVAPFHLDAGADVYVKVIPAPNNPAYANGTAASGWWTRAAIDGDQQGRGSNGTGLMEFGRLAEGNHTLRLDVTVPPGALARPRQHELRYALAMRGAAGDGSGGQLDPSLSVNPRIVVSETAAATVPELAAADGTPSWLLVGAAALGTLGILVLRWRGRRNAPPG